MTNSEAASDKPKKPKKRRWYHNVVDAVKFLKKQEPASLWIIVGILLAVTGAGVAIGIATGHPIYATIVGFMLALLVSMVVLSWRLRVTSFKSLEGQLGASMAVLSEIKRGWNIEQEPVAIAPRTQDVVFRLTGRPGVVLVSEAPPSRAARMLSDEKRKIARVIPSVPIHAIQCGREEGQVPLNKLVRTVKRLEKKLTPQEVAAVSKRLQSLGTLRLPIPKGVDPTKARVDRRGLRGR